MYFRFVRRLIPHCVPGAVSCRTAATDIGFCKLWRRKTRPGVRHRLGQASPRTSDSLWDPWQASIVGGRRGLGPPNHARSAK